MSDCSLRHIFFVDALGFSWTPEKIIAMSLSKMKETAETYVEREETHSVVTVPSYLDHTVR